MRNLKLILSYDGSEFAGWQVQPDAVSVQGTLASAIGRITGEKVLPQGSGRTDAGVHALAQVAAPDFHARKSSRGKTYRYRIYRAAICPPFLARYLWHYPFPLDEQAML